MLRVFEAFAGIGAPRKALENLKIDHEVVAISEIDKFAIQSYEAIYGPVNNLGDISKVQIDDIPDHDLFTYGFPCQDISVAGEQKGFDENSGTRSSLLWECHRIISNKKPKYLLLENVKNLVGKKHKEHFNKWLKKLEDLGYTNYWQILNAKNYGVPQNRERVYVVSILGNAHDFRFAEGGEITKTLKDVCEKKADEKYYLPEWIQARFRYSLEADNKNDIKIVGNTNPDKKIQQRGRVYGDDGISGALMATDYKQPKKIIKVGHIQGCGREVSSRVYTPDGLSPTLDTAQGGGRRPKILDLPVAAASRGRNPANPSDRTSGSPTEQRVEINKNRTTNTLTTVKKDNLLINQDHRIRYLTPLEYWRLMGFADEDFLKAELVCSNTQLYKQAGNSIVVNVLEAIFKNLLIGR